MKRQIILAAGGIVWKKVSGEYRIALVYRERYGGKWSLPKGKLNENETWIEAALREIEEEVGVRASIIKFADTLHYFVEDTPKVVNFWHMKAVGEGTIPRDEEVVNVGWFTPGEAQKMVDYEDEKELLAGLEFPEAVAANGMTDLLKYLNPVRLMGNFFENRSRRERIEGDLLTFRVELNHLIREAGQNGKMPSWAVAASELLSNAEKELAKNHIDLAWKHFHVARRMQLYGLNKQQLLDIADSVRVEAAKLNEWRRKAIYSLIGDPENPHDTVSADSLFRAAELRDEHFNNSYYKSTLLREVFSVLLTVMSITILAIVIYFILVDPFALIQSNNAGDEYITNHFSMVMGVVLFGILGGSISSLFHVRDSSLDTRIPEIVNNNFMTLMRVFLGAGAALVIYVFLQSEFASLLLQDIDLQPDSPYTYFALSFVAGFTERLLLKAVASIAGRE